MTLTHSAAQAYTARILAFVEGREPLAVLSETPRRLRELVAQCPPNRLAWKPEPSRWSVTEIAAHLADAEIVGAYRIRSILGRDGVPIQAYDQDDWARALEYHRQPAAESVTLFEACRIATLGVIKRVSPALLANAGLHQERGRETVEHVLRLYAGHDLNHLGQIERLLQQMSGDV